MKKSALFGWCLAGLGLLALWGMVRLLSLRLSQGDVYPPYSSLRTDPLGAKVFFEGLDGLPGVDLTRNYRPPQRLGAARGAALFMLGTPFAQLNLAEGQDARALEEWVRQGGRLIVALLPASREFGSDTPPWVRPSRERAKDRREPDDSPTNSEPMGPFGAVQEPVDLLAEFGVKITPGGARAARDAPGRSAVPERGLAGLEPLAWHASVKLRPATNAWTTIYRDDSAPAVIERPFGLGTVVLCADTYPFSNESIYKQPSPGFLAWCVGPARRVIFDETHLGVGESSGVASLLRQYRLHGLVVGGLLLGALFVWRNAVPLVPSSEIEAPARSTAIQGREGFDGMVNLLRRSIEPGKILEVCFGEWRRRGAREAGERAARAEALLRGSRQGGDPSPVYREIQKVLSRKGVK
jgi:hypothetical protein